MNALEYLQQYLEGWRTGNAEQSHEMTAEGFTYHDPNTGLVPRENFVAFFKDFVAYGSELNDGVCPQPFLIYTDTLIDEEAGMAWCWWRVNNSHFQGAAQMRFGEAGVISERIAYFSQLPENAEGVDGQNYLC